MPSTCKVLSKLGQARGVVLLAAAQFDIPLFEYSATEVKRAVVGYGRAEKVQIQMMVQTLLSPQRKTSASRCGGCAGGRSLSRLQGIIRAANPATLVTSTETRPE